MRWRNSNLAFVWLVFMVVIGTATMGGLRDGGLAVWESYALPLALVFLGVKIGREAERTV